MKRRITFAATAASVGAMLLLASCSADTTSSSADASKTHVKLVDSMPAATRGLDHTLRWNAAEPQNIDPSFTGSGQLIYSNMCENVLLQKPDYSIVPNLGTVKQANSLTYDVTLRQDVKFWDGTPMTAADAVWTFSRQLDPSLGSNFQAYTANIAGVHQTGEFTYTITMKQPDVMLEPLLATGFGSIVEKAWGEAHPGKIGTPDGGLMCTGPYVLDKWTPGQSITMSANPAYWDKSRTPLTKNVEFVFNSDPTSVTASMVGGELDGGFDFSLSALEQLQKSNGTITFGPSLGFWNVYFVDVPHNPLNTQQRKALKLAMDYKGILNGVLKGAAEEDRALTPRTSWGYSKSTFQAAWDKLDGGRQNLDEAKAIIKKAGVPKGTLVIPYLADNPEMSQVANAIASAAESLGMKTKLRSYPTTQYYQLYSNQSARASSGISLFILNGYMDAIPEPTAWYLNYTKETFGSIFNVPDSPLDGWVHEASRTLDDKARAELIVKAQKYYSDHELMMALAAPYTRVWTAKGVTGAPASDTYRVFPWAAAIGTK